jgi:hypothetical protein
MVWEFRGALSFDGHEKTVLGLIYVIHIEWKRWGKVCQDRTDGVDEL